MADTHQDFYIKLRMQVHQWVESKRGENHRWLEWVLLVPDFFHLLMKLSLDPEVPSNEKIKLAAVIAYFILPTDLLPEWILGAPGYLDDLVVACYVLQSFFQSAGEDKLNEHWAGEGDILEHVTRVVERSDELLGSGLVNKIRRFVKKS